MRVLNIGSGTNLFNVACEDRVRLIEYGNMSERFDTLVSCVGNFTSQSLSDKTFLHGSNSRFYFMRPIDTIRRGATLLREHKADVIFCQDPLLSGFVALLLSKLYDTKLVVSVFGTCVFDKYWRMERWYNPLIASFGAFVLRRADVIQTDGLGNLQLLQARYGQKVFWKPIVPSDIDKYRVSTKNFVSEKTRLLFVGRMAAQKNIKMLASVINNLRKKVDPDLLQILLIGDGPEIRHLEQFRGQAGIEFIANCNRQELDEAYKRSDILIMTSLYEGFPRVFMEAAANGLSFVVTAVSGAENVVAEGKNGFIVQQDDEAGFVESLRILVTDRTKLKNFCGYTLLNFAHKYETNMSLGIHRDILNYLSSPI